MEGALNALEDVNNGSVRTGVGGGVMSSLIALKNLITVSAGVTKYLYPPKQIFRNITIFYRGRGQLAHCYDRKTTKKTEHNF